MACICDFCDSEIDLDEAEETDDGEIICSDCKEEQEEELNEETGKPRKLTKPIYCVGKPCGEYTYDPDAFIEKIPGFMCVSCAHAYELSIHSAGHEAENCAICSPKPKAA